MIGRTWSLSLSLAPRCVRRPGDTCDHDPIFYDAIENAWYEVDGEGDMPGLVRWLQMMEVALRRMTVTA
jgi:hypothetical protein